MSEDGNTLLDDDEIYKGGLGGEGQPGLKRDLGLGMLRSITLKPVLMEECFVLATPT